MKHFALIGHPIAHSISPFIHSKLFELSGIDASYDLIDIIPSQLAQYHNKLCNLDGYNVTIPYKNIIMKYIKSFDDTVLACKAANTVYKGKGYNTDGYGFLKALQYCNCELKDKVVIIGYGGVARVIVYEALKNGCDVDILVRPQSMYMAKLMAQECKYKSKAPSVYDMTNYYDKYKNIALLINATPIGMNPYSDAMPEINKDLFQICKVVFDAIYTPITTKLLSYAKMCGCKTISGISMLVFQAVKSHEIWYKGEFLENSIIKLCDEAKKYIGERT